MMSHSYWASWAQPPSLACQCQPEPHAEFNVQAAERHACWPWWTQARPVGLEKLQSAPVILYCSQRYFSESNTICQALRCQSSFSTDKTCMSTLHIFILDASRLFQEGGPLPHYQNLPTAKSRCFVLIGREESCLVINLPTTKSKCFAWQKLLSKKNGPIWDVSEADMNLFLVELEIHPELRHCDFDVNVQGHLDKKNRISFNNF